MHHDNIIRYIICNIIMYTIKKTQHFRVRTDSINVYITLCTRTHITCCRFAHLCYLQGSVALRSEAKCAIPACIQVRWTAGTKVGREHSDVWLYVDNYTVAVPGKQKKNRAAECKRQVVPSLHVNRQTLLVFVKFKQTQTWSGRRVDIICQLVRFAVCLLLAG